MDERSRRVRYRGYRPPPLWWYKLKYFAGTAVFALFAVFSFVQIVLAMLTGKTSAIFPKTEAAVYWSSAPWHFIGQMILWCVLTAMFFGGFYALLTALRGLKGPSAETRL